MNLVSRSIRTSLIASLFISIVLIIILSGPGSSRVIVVDDDGGQWADHTTIRDAMNASNPGDTVLVYAGNYSEGIWINQSIVIEGNGSKEVILDNNDGVFQFLISANDVAISGISMPPFAGNPHIIDCRNVSITDCIFNVEWSWLNIMNVDVMQFKDNTFISTNPFGTTLSIEESTLVDVHRCTFYGWGIAGYLSELTVQEVTVVDAFNSGITLVECNDIQILDTEVSNSGVDGILLVDSEYVSLNRGSVSSNGEAGINISMSMNITITKSDLTDNDGDGIQMNFGSHWNRITHNTFTSNGGYGVSIIELDRKLSCENNTVHNNRFFDNNLNTTQGYDNCSGNNWDSGVEGNYWSDGSTGDTDRDGIVDDPYPIAGGNSSDRYPLVYSPSPQPKPPNASIISINPDPAAHNEFVEFHGLGHSGDSTVTQFVWTSSIDGELYNGTPTLFTTDSLSHGVHNITFYVMDDQDLSSEVVNGSVLVNIRPIVTIEYPVNNMTVNSSIIILGTASDTDGDVSMVEVSIAGNVWTTVIGTTEWGFTLNHSSFPLGALTVTVRSWDGYHNSETETIILYVASPDSVNRPRKDGDDSRLPEETTVIIGVAALIAVGVFAATGIGFYTLFSLVFPIYTRLRSEDVADHKVRGRIIEFIRQNPGAHYTMIRKELHLPNGSTGYHLRVLETEGFIRSNNDGFYKRFYPFGKRIPRFELIGIETEIMKVVLLSPGISQGHLAKLVGLSQSTMSYHIKRLRNRNIVNASRKDGITPTQMFLEALDSGETAEQPVVGEPSIPPVN